jgi:hypothetical protein
MKKYIITGFIIEILIILMFILIKFNVVSLDIDIGYYILFIGSLINVGVFGTIYDVQRRNENQ